MTDHAGITDQDAGAAAVLQALIQFEAELLAAGHAQFAARVAEIQAQLRRVVGPLPAPDSGA